MNRPSQRHRPRLATSRFGLAFIIACYFFCALVPSAVAEEAPDDGERETLTTADEVDEAEEVDDVPETTSPMTTADVVADDRTEEPTRGDLDDEQAAEFSSLMNSALEAEEEERYEEAQQDFVRAYSIFPHSNILLSVARVSDRADDHDTAKEGYQNFLERQPDYQNRAQIEQRIDELEKEAKPDEVEEVDDQGLIADLDPSTLGWVGIGATAVGLVSMFAGGRVASSVDSDFDRLEQHRADGNATEFAVLSSDIDSKQSRGKFLLYGGLGMTLVGAGLATYDLFFRDQPSVDSGVENGDISRLSVEPLGRNGAALRWSATF